MKQKYEKLKKHKTFHLKIHFREFGQLYKKASLIVILKKNKETELTMLERKIYKKYGETKNIFNIFYAYFHGYTND